MHIRIRYRKRLKFVLFADRYSGLILQPEYLFLCPYGSKNTGLPGYQVPGRPVSWTLRLNRNIMRTLTLLSTILFLNACNGQTGQEDVQGLAPLVESHFFTIGENRVSVKTYRYGPSEAPVFISLHDDEITSVEAAKEFLSKHGGSLIRIENGGERLVRFKHNGRNYSFDPNRMFSSRGISLAGGSNAGASLQVERFASKFLELVPSHSCLIALHNNTEGRLSIRSYQAGNDLAGDARRVHANSNLDPDDFFLTTDSAVYERLKEEGFNTVWQDNVRATKDGSLSVWCGERNLCYVNCETQHGNAEAYRRMLNALVNILDGKTSTSSN